MLKCDLENSNILKESPKPKKVIHIKSPIDESDLGDIISMNKDEVDTVFNRAKKAFCKWKDTTLDERAEILYRAANILDENTEKYSNMLVNEISKDKKSSTSEIKRTADYIRYTADAARAMFGESILGENFKGGSKNKLGIVLREPLGVVLAISPFNYPINLSASKIAPALIGGNCVVLKPPTQGALSAINLVEAFYEAGVPKDVLGVITGKGEDIGDYSVTHNMVDFINFTGSTEIGFRISKQLEMKPYLMELGGKDSAIVLNDCDLELTSKNIIEGAFSYSGQRCTAIKRVLVMESLANKLVQKLKLGIENLKVGNPKEEQVDIVPLINSKACDYVESLINDAKDKGAEIITGGMRDKNIIYPTLVDNVREDMKLAWEEPFGPVLPIIRVKDVEEAIKISNKSKYGLEAAIFTSDIKAAREIARKLEVGVVQINGKTERGPDHFPFLGVKASGLGTQGIKYSIEAMTRPKVFVINS